jgi:hypothetical protein
MRALIDQMQHCSSLPTLLEAFVGAESALWLGM